MAEIDPDGRLRLNQDTEEAAAIVARMIINGVPHGIERRQKISTKFDFGKTIR